MTFFHWCNDCCSFCDSWALCFGVWIPTCLKKCKKWIISDGFVCLGPKSKRLTTFKMTKGKAPRKWLTSLTHKLQKVHAFICLHISMFSFLFPWRYQVPTTSKMLFNGLFRFLLNQRYQWVGFDVAGSIYFDLCRTKIFFTKNIRNIRTLCHAMSKSKGRNRVRIECLKSWQSWSEQSWWRFLKLGNHNHAVVN